MHPALVRRLVRYGHGFNPLGRQSDESIATLEAAMKAAGRRPEDLELIGGTRAVFPDNDSCADLGQALSAIQTAIAEALDS